MDSESYIIDLISQWDEHGVEKRRVFPDPWLAASALQKAIRRGDRRTARTAVSILVETAPDRMWRRLVVIAMEDVGIADLPLVAAVLWVSGRAAWRRQHGGEERMAAALVDALCRAPKCRGACDVLVVADLHPALAELRRVLPELSDRELGAMVADPGRALADRVLAAWFVAGTDRFPGAQLAPRRGSIRALLDVYAHLGIPSDILDIGARGATRTQEGFPISLPLVWARAATAGGFEVLEEECPSLGFVAGWPSEAVDMHTRPGRRALSLFVAGDNADLNRVLGQVRPGLREEIVGTAVFRVEGAVVDRLLTYRGSDQILKDAEVAHLTWAGGTQEMAAELLDRVQRDLHRLHDCRVKAMGERR